MSNPVTKLESLLRQHGFKLVRQTKHLVYRNHEGKLFVTSKTPSDHRAVRNMVSTLERVIASPVPTSEVVEEERQRKALEPTIQLTVTVKPLEGMQGAGKKAMSKGVGIFYDDDKRLKQEEERKRREIFLASDEGRLWSARKAKEEEERKQRREIRRLEEEWDRQLGKFRRQTQQWEEDYLNCRRFMVNSLMFAKSRQMFKNFLSEMKEEGKVLTTKERQEGFQAMFIEVVRVASIDDGEAGEKLRSEIWEALENRGSDEIISAILYQGGRAPKWTITGTVPDFQFRPSARLLLRRSVKLLSQGRIVDSEGDGISPKSPTPQWIIDAVLALCVRRLKLVEAAT